MAFDLPGVEPGSDPDQLFKAVGFVVIQWGHAEQTLDLLVTAVFSCYQGHKLLNHRPTQLKDKINLLRKCFVALPELAPFNNECEDLLSRFKEFSKRRNDIVHGAIDSLSAENGVFTFTKIDVPPKQHHKARKVILDESEFAEYRRALMKLGADGSSLSRRVWDAIKPKRPQVALNEFT